MSSWLAARRELLFNSLQIHTRQLLFRSKQKFQVLTSYVYYFLELRGISVL